MLRCCSIQFISTRPPAPCTFFSTFTSLPYSRGLFSVCLSSFPFFLFSPFQYYYYYLCDGKCAHTEDRRPSTGGVEHREQQSKMEKYFRTTSLTDCVGVALIIMTLSSLCRFVCRSSFFSVLCFAHDTRRKKRQTFSVTENILLCHKTFPPTYTPSSHMPKWNKSFFTARSFFFGFFFLLPAAGTLLVACNVHINVFMKSWVRDEWDTVAEYHLVM